MPEEIIDTTCMYCNQKNLLIKRLTKEVCRCDRCQSQLSNLLVSSTLQPQSALEGGKIISFSVLVSVGLLVFPVGTALGSSQSLPLSFPPITSQPKPLPNPPIITASNRSLPSDPVFVSQAMGGGSLEVSNGTNRDAYVKLIEPLSRTLVTAFHVKSNSTLTVNQIPDGTYRVIFALGKNWNPKTQSFTQSKSFAKYDKSLNYTTMQFSDQIQYKAFRITLHPVTGGQARTSGVNEQEFKSY
ncbi:hypothetical protein [Altericista sp. CCNU0014]|uniref:hypothetical protein n=1 Tax=Altericista sp. CCNU0014 TaxID=3082949 RepID=UPI00384D90FC